MSTSIAEVSPLGGVGGVSRAELVICRGLPGSGKTTYACDRIRFRAEGAVARVSHEECRRVMFNVSYRGNAVVEMSRTARARMEGVVTVALHAAVRALLCSGVDVICDDTNLGPVSVRGLMRCARDSGATWRIHDFTDVPVQTCLDRDAQRASSARAGEDLIRVLFELYSGCGWAPLPVPDL